MLTDAVTADGEDGVRRDSLDLVAAEAMLEAI